MLSEEARLSPSNCHSYRGRMFQGDMDIESEMLFGGPSGTLNRGPMDFKFNKRCEMDKKDQLANQPQALVPQSFGVERNVLYKLRKVQSN